MRFAITVLVPAVLALWQTVPAGDKAKQELKDGGITWKMDYLDKTWGIKFKSATVDPKFGEFKLLFEFGKDVTELKPMREALAPITGVPKPGGVKLYFYCFDEDNVSIGKCHHSKLEGELTGKSGDAFKIWFNLVPNNLTSKVKKVEVRPRESEEKTQ